MSDLLDRLLKQVENLSDADLRRILDYIEFIHWQNTQQVVPAGGMPWVYSFLEHFSSASVKAVPNAAGMEVKVGEAMVGGLARAALWEHPPVVGDAIVEYHVPIPSGVHNLRLRFSVGIRDGARVAEDQLVAFRVLVGGWKIWNAITVTQTWQPYEVSLQQVAGGDILPIAFVTDALGTHGWSWAVWAEPELIGERIA